MKITKEVKGILKEIDKFDSDKVPIRMFKFIMDHPNLENAAELYPELIAFMPEEFKKPSFNQWMYFYNMTQLQKLIDAHNPVMKKTMKEMVRLLAIDDPTDDEQKALKRVKSEHKALEGRLHGLLKDVIKYSSVGIDRETPRKVEHQITKFNITDIQSAMRDYKHKIQDADYKEK